jgi:hypothetical protein
MGGNAGAEMMEKRDREFKDLSYDEIFKRHMKLSDTYWTLTHDEKRMTHRLNQELERRDYEQNPLPHYADIISPLNSGYESLKEMMKDIERLELVQALSDCKDDPDKIEERIKLVEHRSDVWTLKEREEFVAQWVSHHVKPKGMTKTEWQKEQSGRRRLLKQQRKADTVLESNSPILRFSEMIEDLGYRCECKGERMRRGEFCRICKLGTKLTEYAINLFKDAAEGRSSLV